MTPRRTFARHGLLLLLAMALGLLNWTLARMPIDISPVAADAAGPEPDLVPSTPADATAARALGDFRETVERPLFHESRRPVAPRVVVVPAAAPGIAAPEPPPPAAEPSRLSLVGLMGTSPKARRALIRPEGQPYGTWVGVGGEIEGWRLAIIDENRVVIEKDGGREELVLHARPEQ